MFCFNPYYLVFVENALCIVSPACASVFISSSLRQAPAHTQQPYENTHIHIWKHTKTHTVCKAGVCNYLCTTALQNAMQCLHQRVCVESFVISRIHLNTFGWVTPGILPVCSVWLHLSLLSFSQFGSHIACSVPFISNLPVKPLVFSSPLCCTSQETDRSMFLLTSRVVCIMVDHRGWKSVTTSGCFLPSHHRLT